MFANCQLTGINFAMPDTCKTPTPAGPVPIPYPNISQQSLAVPFVPQVLLCGCPAHNMGSMPPISNGDEAGVAMGVVSSMVMGPTRHMRGSTVLLTGGMPATRFLDTTGQNGATPNAVGTTLAPSQTKVIVLR
jgi:hypothetical protein